MTNEITDMYAFVTEGETGEDIIGRTMIVKGREMFMPFVVGSYEKAEVLKPLAKKIAVESNQKVKLVKFTKREEMAWES